MQQNEDNYTITWYYLIENLIKVHQSMTDYHKPPKKSLFNLLIA